MTREQAATFKKLVLTYIKKYPNITVMGHNQIKHKSCPWFWAPTYLKGIGVKDKNIWEPGFKSGKNTHGKDIYFGDFYNEYNKGKYITDAETAAKITGLKSGA
jgi:hypothetical protein